MQTLLPECSEALSIATLGRGSIEHGLSITHVPLPPVELGVGEHEPLRELQPYAAIASAALAESTDSRLGAATRASGGGRASASDVPEATHLTESEFVLALPMTLSARETVARASEQGLTISEAFVYKVRYDAMAAPEPASAALVTAQVEQGLEVAAAQGQGAAPAILAAPVTPAASSAPRAPATRARPTPSPTKAALSKADFVRSLPPEMSFAEASARARYAGIALSSAHFYALKSQLKKRAAAPAPNSKPVREPKVSASGAFEGLRLTSDDSREQALLDAVRVLGSSRARAVIDVVEKFERLIE